MQVNPKGKYDYNRGCRGGGYRDEEHRTTSARGVWPKAWRSGGIGFRVVMGVKYEKK